VHNVGQWPNLRHLAEPLGGAVGLLEPVSFKEAMEITDKCEIQYLLKLPLHPKHAAKYSQLYYT